MWDTESAGLPTLEQLEKIAFADDAVTMEDMAGVCVCVGVCVGVCVCVCVYMFLYMYCMHACMYVSVYIQCVCVCCSLAFIV